MKALVLTQYKQLQYLDVADPAPGPDEVLIAVRACGICGSDVHGIDGSTGRRRPPIVMGHEAAGTIAAAGRDVRGWQVGDRVTFDSTVYCGRCRHCLAGAVNLCDARRVLGVSCEEYRQPGAFAQLVAVPERILYRLPDGMTFEDAAMVEPVAIAVHAVGRARPRLGERAAVVGAGMIGLCAVQALRAAGCVGIAAVDVDRGRLELARQLGADKGATPEEATELVAESAAGFDLVVEAVGRPETVELAIGLVRKGGRVVLVGNVSPKVTLPLQSVVTRELTLLGSCASAGEYGASLALIAGGAIRVTGLRSAVAPLADGAAWFQRLYQREPGLLKVVLAP